MFNLPVPNFLYYSFPHFNLMGPNFQPSYYVSVLPSQGNDQIQEVQSVEAIEIQKNAFLEDSQPSSESFQAKRKLCSTRTQTKTIRKGKRNKRQEKKLSEKNIFKNAYLSFAVHKLMYFINERYMTERLLRSLAQTRNKPEEQVERLVKTFYQQHLRVIKYVVNNSSIKRLRELWTGGIFSVLQDGADEEQREFLAFVYRTLSRIYFSSYYPPFILRSKKVKKMSLPYHLKMRTYLLKCMEKPEEFRSYNDFE